MNDLPKLTKDEFEKKFYQEVKGKLLTKIGRYNIALKVLCDFKPVLTNPFWWEEWLNNNNC